MATVSFDLRSSKNKSTSTINIRFSWSKEFSPFRKSLGIKINDKNWNLKKQRLKVNSETYLFAEKENEFLNELQKHFLTEYNKIHLHKMNVSKIDVDRIYYSFKNKKKSNSEIEYFLPFIQDYIETINDRKNPKTGKPVGLRSKQDYERTYKSLKEFEKFHKVQLTFIDIDIDFHNSFTNYLNTQENLTNKNTVGAFFKNIRMFIKYAESKGVKINKESLSKGFYVSSEDSPSIYLNPEEINKLFEHDFTKNLRHSNIRDWCIIGCWTGLRVSDWNRIGEIEEGMITIKPSKTSSTTGVEVVIPLHWQIIEIINKRGLPKKISDVEYNRIIKKVCMEVKINENVKGSLLNKKTKRKEIGLYNKYQLISSHTCRRSFATNFYNSGLSSYTIMQVTGHKTERAFLTYIKVTPKEHAIKLKEHMNIHFNKKTLS